MSTISATEKASFDVIDEKGRYVSPSNLPEGTRKILFNKDELIAAKERSAQSPEAVVETSDVPVEDVGHEKQHAVLTKKLDDLQRIEELRDQLGVTALNRPETDTIVEKKMEIQQALTGVRQQKSEIGEVGQENSTPDEWKDFKKEWFGENVPQEHEYIDTARKIMSFSEKLASQDPDYKKKLSQEVFENEKYDSLSNFKGINDEGKLITKGGSITNFPYNIAGFSLKRAEYEGKLVEAYAREKGIL